MLPLCRSCRKLAAGRRAKQAAWGAGWVAQLAGAALVVAAVVRSCAPSSVPGAHWGSKCPSSGKLQRTFLCICKSVSAAVLHSVALGALALVA